MGEGLHFLPGMGHPCDHSIACEVLSPIAGDFNGHSGGNFPAITHSDRNPHAINNIDDCAVCKFFSLVKTCISLDSDVSDHIIVAERLAIYSSLLESRFIGSYQSRAPPRDLLQA
jgi:hypothetical protein